MKRYIAPQTELLRVKLEGFITMSLHDGVGDEQLGKHGFMESFADSLALPDGPDVWED